MEIGRDDINGLPGELLCEILRLAIDSPWKTREDRCRLCLVCRLWRQHVEDSAIVWTDISARDGPTYMRLALERSKEALINLSYPAYSENSMELGAFLAEAGPYIARWRSLTVAIRSPPSSQDTAWAPLTTSRAPGLESLELSLVGRGPSIPQNAITLFNGHPAPPTLKNLTLRRIQVAIEPLGLSGLMSLDLTHVHTISTTQLLEILRSSPSLETLSLAENPRLVALASQPPSTQPIVLPKLVFLSLGGIDHGGANSILSTIRIPKRRRIYISSDIARVHAQSVLFTSSIAHILHPTTPTSDPRFSDIEVEVLDDDDCTIRFRGLELDLWVQGADQIQGILGWLAEGLGSEAAACPVRLSLDWSDLDPLRLVAVPSPLAVNHLSISESLFISLHGESLCGAMLRPPSSTSSGWLLAQMESLSVEFDTAESQRKFVSMLRSRYGEATSKNETELRCPMRLRSVELRGYPKAEGLVDEIKGILGEGNVFWAK